MQDFEKILREARDEYIISHSVVAGHNLGGSEKIKKYTNGWCFRAQILWLFMVYYQRIELYPASA
jgi:hypothetical protein